MFQYLVPIGAVIIGITVITGCSDVPIPKKIEVKSSGASDELKMILDNYVKGQPMSSEADSFDDILKRMGAKGEDLKKDLSDLKNSPSQLKSKAEAILKKL